MNPGEIYFNSRHYADQTTGEIKGKFFLVLAVLPGADLVARVLTSRPHGRREAPPCCHDDPYPSFYLAVLGDPLTKKSWLDLRPHPNIDPAFLQQSLKRGTASLVRSLDKALLVPVMECVAGAEDTTVQEEKSIRDMLAKLR